MLCRCLQIKHDKSLKKVNSFDVGFELVMSLVKPFVAGRSINGLSLTQQNKMSIILWRNVGTANDQPNHDSFEFTRLGSRQRCHTCLSDISGKEHIKRRKTISKRFKQNAKGVEKQYVIAIPRLYVIATCEHFS